MYCHLKATLNMSTPLRGGSTYCFTYVRFGVLFRLLVRVMPITKGTSAQFFLGGMFFVLLGIGF